MTLYTNIHNTITFDLTLSGTAYTGTVCVWAARLPPMESSVAAKFPPTISFDNIEVVVF